MKCKVGDIFQYNYKNKTVTLKVIEDKKQTCTGCFFFNENTPTCTRDNSIDSCSSPIRTDKTDIIFKQIDNNNNMEEKRNIQISLEEAREWYNSGDSFKKELALKAYKEKELKELNYAKIKYMLSTNIIYKNSQKHITYLKLINVAAYLNNIYPIKYCKESKENICYVISNIKCDRTLIYYKGFHIHKIYPSCPEAYLATFNSEEAAKEAIDILGDELKILFE